ncbi:MAG: hypothetical protein R3E01_35845 [Pirellulaceae bacterium]
MLDREEYIEQAYFFGTLNDRLDASLPLQDLLGSLRDELLATTRLPLAIDFLLSELMHCGVMSTAMRRLEHYFAPFQTHVISEAEKEEGRFDMRVGLQILRDEAKYRAENGGRPGLFLYQFEVLCRNRLNYDRGLEAMSRDPAYDESWRTWILAVRREVGIVEVADMIYSRSEHYVMQLAREGHSRDELPPPLFGQREGRIAQANRRKDPLLLFSALQRQLGYPAVPRLKPYDSRQDLVPQMARRLERLEARMKLMEEEQKGGIDITRFYHPDQ